MIRIVALSAFVACMPLASAVASTVDGEWHAVLPNDVRSGQTAIYDSAREQMIVFGGAHGGEVWALSLSGNPEWNPIVASGTQPASRASHTAVYDPIRDRMLVFGGDPITQALPTGELWELTLSGAPTWNRLTPSGATPHQRKKHTAVYDPVRDRMVIFGGYDGSTASNDVWVLSLSGAPAWTELSPTGTPPSPRFGHTAIYDAARDRMLVFGGWDGIGFDPTVWSLSLSGSPTWSTVSVSGSSPPGRWGHAAIYDPVHDRIIMFGGGTIHYPHEENGVWELTLSGSPQWSMLNPSGPASLINEYQSAFYDPERDRMVVFGGGGLSPYSHGWALALSGNLAWSPLLEAPISSRTRHSAIHDPVRDRMLVFGGPGYPSAYNDVWELPLSGAPDWNQLNPSGSAPPGRWGHTAIYDPVRDRMIVFGGSSFDNVVRVLELSGTLRWRTLATSGTPPPGLFEHSAIYDPVRDQMIVYGGIDEAGNGRDAVWLLTLSGSPTWTAWLPPSLAHPPSRYHHTAVYDPERDRMLVYGGRNEPSSFDDVWSLWLGNTPQWTLLEPIGPKPPGRSYASAVYDPVRSRMVLFGGFTGDGFETNQVWSLIASGTEWRAVTPSGDLPSSRADHTAIYDPARDEMVLFGGIGGNRDVGRNDVWKLSWDFLVNDVPMPRTSPSLLRAPRPNPMYSSAEIRYELAEEVHVSLDVIDIQGRIVRRLRAGAQRAGSHTVKFDRSDDRGRSLPAGLYLIRLGTRGATRTTRIVILP